MVKTVIFSLIPVALLLLVLEITGRIIYPFDPDGRALVKADRDPRISLSYLSGDGRGETILYDIHRKQSRYVPFLGWIGEQNTDLTTIKTNAAGFRDKPIQPRKANERRILITGGSTAWGLGASSNEATVAGALERLLNNNAEGVSYRVMSGAYPAWQSRHELVSVMEYYDLFDPDLIITLTGYNDLYGITHGGRDELHTRPESRMLAKAVEESLQPMSTMRALRKVGGSLGIWRIVVYFREKTQLASPAKSSVKFDANRARQVIPKIVDRYVTMADFSNRRGAGLMIAVQPDIYTTGKPLTREEALVRERFTTRFEHIAGTYSKYRADFLHELERQIPHEDTTVLDLKGVFDAIDDRPLFLDDCHLNDAGYGLIATNLLTAVNDYYGSLGKLPPLARTSAEHR